MSAEKWRPVPGTWGYEVSDRGQVRSSRPCRRLPVPRLLHPSRTGRGYLVVNIMVDGRPKLRLVHQLVLEAFVGPRPDEAMGVRHLNDDPTDNTLGNLAWGTYGENMQDRVTNGIHHYAKRTHCKHGHEYTPENTKILTGKRTGRVCLTCQRRNRNDRATAEAVTS